jgi:hypothetical protein
VAIDEWTEQIVNYLLVADRDRFGFEEVVLYLAREGVVFRWPAVELLSKLSGRAGRPSTFAGGVPRAGTRSHRCA